MICQYGYSPFPPLRASGEGFGVGGGGDLLFVTLSFPRTLVVILNLVASIRVNQWRSHYFLCAEICALVSRCNSTSS